MRLPADRQGLNPDASGVRNSKASLLVFIRSTIY